VIGFVSALSYLKFRYFISLEEKISLARELIPTSAKPITSS
jgi:hypothetical protein